MLRPPPTSTRTYPLFPYTTLVRSGTVDRVFLPIGQVHDRRTEQRPIPGKCDAPRSAHLLAVLEILYVAGNVTAEQIGRADVWTPVTNEQIVCRLLLEKKNKSNMQVQHAVTC